MADDPRSHSLQQRLRALDGMRAFAVIVVLGYHAGVVTGGYLGVDVFFVLSGFLITGLLLREQQLHGGISFSRFWLHRLFRLTPALVVFLLVGAAAALALKPAADQRVYLEDAATALFGVNNWWRVSDVESATAWDSHLWSLSVEQQFYLLWPLLLALVLRNGSHRRLIAVLAALVVVVALWRDGIVLHLLGGRVDEHAYLGTDARADSLLVGAMLAVLWRRGLLERVPPGAWVVLSAVSWSLIALALGLSPVLEPLPWWLPWGGYTLVAVAAALGIAGAVTAPHRGISRVFELPALVWLGSVSYAFYLWHYPVTIALEGTLGPRVGRLPAALAAVAVTTLLAWGSMVFVERPVARYRPAVEAWVVRIRRPRAEEPSEPA